MKDFSEDIKTRAKRANVTLKANEIAILNQKINDRILSGTHLFDALDHIYFEIRNNYAIPTIKGFNEQGNRTDDLISYFDSNGFLINFNFFITHYKIYPCNSDIVKMYYAEIYATKLDSKISSFMLYLRTFL